MKKTSKLVAALMALCMMVAFAACAPAENTPAGTDADALVATATGNMQAADGMSYIMNMVMDMEVMIAKGAYSGRKILVMKTMAVLPGSPM